MKNLKDVLEKIDLLQSEIDAHGKLDADLVKRIDYKFRLDWNYYSNAMEGNSLTRIETKQLMMDNVTIEGKPFKDIFEMRGHDNEVLEILKVGKGQDRISERRIKNMHKAIMHEDDPAKKGFIGEWKTVNNKLTNFRGENFDFLPHDEVPEAMHDLLNKTNADIDALESKKSEAKHPVQIAFEFHIRYVRIHPFYDGNGRTARLLTNLLLISFGYPPFLLSDKSRDKYNRILGEIQGYGGDENDFYIFLGGLLIESQELVLDAIAGKNISGDDDVDKEILLWKQSLLEGTDEVIEKYNASLHDIYSTSIESLFQRFIEKHDKFRDLFTDYQITNYVNDIGGVGSGTGRYFFDEWKVYSSGVKAINDEIDDVETRVMLIAKLNESRPAYDKLSKESNVNSLELRINFRGFKKNVTNIFNDWSSITIIFDQFKYSIADEKGRFDEKYQKLYSQIYTEQEVTGIVNEKTKAFLEKLKSRMKD